MFNKWNKLAGRKVAAIALAIVVAFIVWVIS